MDQILISKSASQFVAEDFSCFPVWEYKAAGSLLIGEDESWMCPSATYPLDDLLGHAVGVQAELADGSSVWIAIFNTWALDPEMNEQSQSFMFLADSSRFIWSPSGHHGNIGRTGAAGVATFLGKPIDSIFPFCYDISAYAHGHMDSLKRCVAVDGPQGLADPVEAAMHAAMKALEHLRDG